MTTRRVYPRVCGGTRQPPRPTVKRGGLSPRVRGNRIDCALNPRYAGSIPACAGEPSSMSRRGSRIRVYPRVCGGTL